MHWAGHQGRSREAYTVERTAICQEGTPEDLEVQVRVMLTQQHDWLSYRQQVYSHHHSVVQTDATRAYRMFLESYWLTDNRTEMG